MPRVPPFIAGKAVDRFYGYRFDVLIFGFGRFGKSIGKRLEEGEASYLAIDYDPELVRKEKANGRNLIYGDLEDPEILDRIPLRTSKCIVSTVPDSDVVIGLMKGLKDREYGGESYLIARQEWDKAILEEHAPNKILLPHDMVAENLYHSHLKGFLEEERSEKT